MNEVKGYLIETEGRALFLREGFEWALSDSNYKVTPLVAQEIVLDSKNMHKTEHSFDDYRETAESLYALHSEQLSQTKAILEDAVELLESIADLASKKTDNVMEMKGLLALIAQDCKKFLAPE